MIPIDKPQISVVLKKNIGRSTLADGIPASQRYTGTQREIDLTPFLTERSHVVVRKSVRAPAGMFSIALGDKLPNFEQESLYALIEPMDIVEIRMARDISIYTGLGLERSMPLIMRGFVTEVGREEVMFGSHDAQPSRSIVISGHDYGKLLTMSQIRYLPNMVTGQNLTTYFKFFANYTGDQPVFQGASAFVEGVISAVVNPLIGEMIQATTSNAVSGGSSPVSMLQVDATVQDGVVSAFGTNAWPGGTVWDLLTYYGDVGPWNELFVEDREDAPYLVYRPNPFKDASGKFIQTIDTSPAVNFIADTDIVSLELSRTDANVANYYWVYGQSFALNAGAQLQMSIAHQQNPGEFFLSNYENCSPKYYGFKIMEAQTQQGQRIDGMKEAAHNKGEIELYDFANQRRQVLMDSNKDSVVFEQGRMTFKGNEVVQAGTYVQLQRGAMTSEAYAVEVTHDFRPFRSYTTSVNFERGTGFIVRSQMGGALSPYFAEMDLGGVYG